MLLYQSTVLDGIKGALALLGGTAALDAASAPCWSLAFSDGRGWHQPAITSPNDVE